MSQNEEIETGTAFPIATPNQGIESINKVISVLFSYNRPAMYKDLSVPTNLHHMTVSQALSASRDLGLTTSGGKKGLYVLTNAGKEYARLLTAAKEKEAKVLLRDLIHHQPAWKEIIAFLKAIRGEARDPLDLVLDVERKLNKSWKSSARNNYRDCYVSILTYAGLIEEKGGKIFSLLDIEVPLEEVPTPISELAPPDFAILQTDDFRFEIRKDADVLPFAKSQFLAWLGYLEKKIAKEEESAE